MSTKRTVKLDPDVYDRVAVQKREGETFSEAIERLIGGEEVSLLDLVDGEGHDPEREREMLEAVDRAEAADQRDLEELEEPRDS